MFYVIYALALVFIFILHRIFIACIRVEWRRWSCRWYVACCACSGRDVGRPACGVGGVRRLFIFLFAGGRRRLVGQAWYDMLVFLPYRYMVFFRRRPDVGDDRTDISVGLYICLLIVGIYRILSVPIFPGVHRTGFAYIF